MRERERERERELWWLGNLADGAICFGLISLANRAIYKKLHSSKKSVIRDSQLCLCVCFCCQHEVSCCLETGENDIHIPTEVTGCDLQPVVVLEKLDLSR